MATTVADHTQFAVPAILTGKASDPDKLPVASEHPDNLFRLLGGRYRLNVMEWVTHLCASTSCPRQIRPSLLHRLRSLLGDPQTAKIPVAPPGITFRLAGWIRPEETSLRAAAEDQATRMSVRRGADRDRTATAELFADSLRADDDPSLDFLHILLPHIDWVTLPSGQRYSSQLFATSPGTWPKDPYISATAYQRHLLQVGYTDRVLGQIVGRLEDEGTYERSLIVVTADHGISFKARRGGPRRQPAKRRRSGRRAAVREGAREGTRTRLGRVRGEHRHPAHDRAAAPRGDPVAHQRPPCRRGGAPAPPWWWIVSSAAR